MRILIALALTFALWLCYHPKMQQIERLDNHDRQEMNQLLATI